MIDTTKVNTPSLQIAMSKIFFKKNIIICESSFPSLLKGPDLYLF